ncbi:hypothetical protein BCR36DRAFT_412367 [Piromyces finnis]|uniref:Uncharacterized protein n=1 Tax=Piromyces finnis TaxID=1754191 RepID=A0A1Y1VAI0_9FUNG|nr:hypothetical protein BCR36DRAFT_412367 [Piromyces finnis]|eukprot:ORX50345.1 hypothetical protein BCR36DRAFT_412367 [Piromyces finnis]
MKENIKKSDIFKYYKDKDLISSINTCIIEWFNYLRLINYIKEDVNIKKKDSDCWFIIDNIDILFKYINQKEDKEKEFQYDILYKVYVGIRKHYRGFTYNYFTGLTLNDINDYNLQFFMNNNIQIQKLISFRKRIFNIIKIDNYTWLITHKKYYRKGKRKIIENKTREFNLDYDIFNENENLDENLDENFDEKIYEIIKKLKINLKRLDIYKLSNDNEYKLDENDNISDTIYSYTENSIDYSESDFHNKKQNSKSKNKKKLKSKLNEKIINIGTTQDLISSNFLKPKKYSNNKEKIKKKENEKRNYDEKYFNININDFAVSSCANNNEINKSLDITFDTLTNSTHNIDFDTNNIRKNKIRKIIDNSSIDFNFSKNNKKYILDDNSATVSLSTSPNNKFNNSFKTPLNSIHKFNENLSIPTSTNMNVEMCKYNNSESKTSQYNHTNADLSESSYLKTRDHSINHLTPNSYPKPSYQKMKDFSSGNENCMFHQLETDYNYNHINFPRSVDISNNENKIFHLSNKKNSFSRDNLFNSDRINEAMDDKTSLGDSLKELKESYNILQQVLNRLNNIGITKSHILNFHNSFDDNNSGYSNSTDGFRNRIQNVMNCIRNSELKNGHIQQMEQNQNNIGNIKHIESQYIYTKEDMEDLKKTIIEDCKQILTKYDTINKRMIRLTSENAYLKDFILKMKRQESNCISNNQIQVILKALNKLNLLNIMENEILSIQTMQE